MLTLQAGDSSLVLAPEIGGSIVGWSWGATPLLRRPEPDAIVSGNVRGLGCFPLVPFSNRIDCGRFRWNGVEHVLERNFGDNPHCIHGIGWQNPWEVASVSTTSAVLTLRHDAVGTQALRWPFAFAAEQHFTLTRDALRVGLALTNLDSAPAPAGLGLHPYFPCTPTSTLRFNAAHVWLNSAGMLPVRAVPVPPEWNHASARRIGSMALDNCFVGWDGHAQIAWAPAGPGLAIEADAVFRHLIVYTPANHDYFCLEPVNHMTDAANRMAGTDDQRMPVLDPGETVRGQVIFRITSAGQQGDQPRTASIRREFDA
jgi:aldose 1-epimerase